MRELGMAARLSLLAVLVLATSASAEGAWVLWLEHEWTEDRWFGYEGRDWTVLSAHENQVQCESASGVYRTRRYNSQKENREAVVVEYLPVRREPPLPLDTVHIRLSKTRFMRDEWFRYLCLPDTVDPRGPKSK
jgi:hypothetical protein